MEISNKTLKNITKKVGDNFNGEFKPFSTDNTEEVKKVEVPTVETAPTPVIETPTPVVQPEPTPVVVETQPEPVSAPVLNRADPKPPTPATNVTIIDTNNTATQVINNGQPTQ